MAGFERGANGTNGFSLIGNQSFAILSSEPAKLSYGPSGVEIVSNQGRVGFVVGGEETGSKPYQVSAGTYGKATRWSGSRQQQFHAFWPRGSSDGEFFYRRRSHWRKHRRQSDASDVDDAAVIH